MISNKSIETISICLLASSFLISGCSTESTESNNIATPGIYANINVDASRSGSSRVNVELNVGGSNGTNIELSDNERLEATVGGQMLTLNKDIDVFDIDYDATFDTSSAADPFRIILVRSDGSTIDNSTISLPEEFSLTSPTTGEVFDENQIIPLRWAPARAGEMITLQTTTSCANTTSGVDIISTVFELDDDGTEDFSVSELPAVTSLTSASNQDCILHVMLIRRQNGSLDTRFEAGGQINSSQSREIDDMVLRLD